MQYTITKNTQFNSIEISFEEKPADSIREALKGLKFRWHSVKKVWYGYTDEATARAAIEGQPVEAKPEQPKTEKVNKFGVKVGDIFHMSWGYEQTNNDFFQVVALAGESSVRIREVHLPLIESQAVSGMSEDRVFQVTRELLQPVERSTFIKDQVRGDLKRLKSYSKDGSNPQINMTSYADAYLVTGDTLKVYESWYA